MMESGGLYNLSPFIDTESKAYKKWGYRLNINNPFVKLLWDRWRDKHSIVKRYPASDEERLLFECEAIPYIEKRFGLKAPAPYIPCGPYRDKLPIELLAKIYRIEDAEVLERLQKNKPSQP